MKKVSTIVVGMFMLLLAGAGCSSTRDVSETSDTLPMPDTSAPAEEVAETKTKPTVTVEMSANGNKYTVKKNGKAVYEIPWKADTEGEIAMFKQTEKFAYVGEYIGGLGGYILYEEAGPIRLYRVNLETDEVKIFSRKKIAVAMDISPDESAAVWKESGEGAGKIIVANLTTGTEESFAVPVKYRQFGNARFSPDGKKIAYAGALGEVGQEAGAVLMVDIAAGSHTTVVETKQKNNYFTVRGWKDDTTVDYSEQESVF